MKEYRNQVFEGTGIVVYEDSIFQNCTFKNIHKSAHWGGDGIICHGPTPDKHPCNPITVRILDCVFDNTGVDPEDSDEAVSGFLNGTNVILENTVIRNWGKGILMGNGDWTEEEEGALVLSCRNCTFENVGRRLPFIRYGTAWMKNCTFKNWGKKGTYEVKGNCIKANLGARVILENCKFVQDRFHLEFSDLLHQFDPDDCFGLQKGAKFYTLKLIGNILIHPIKFLKAWRPGCMKGVELNTGSEVEKDDCEKNHWWISLG